KSKSAGQSIGGGNRTYKPRHANYLMRMNCYSNVKALPRGPKFIQLSNPITGSIYRLNLVTELYPDQNRRNSLNRPRPTTWHLSAARAAPWRLGPPSDTR